MTTTTTVDAAEVQARVDKLLAEHANDDMASFLGAQFDLGLARMDFPVGHGGLDSSPKLQEIVDSALEKAGRRYHWMRNAMGIGMCGPTIVARGTEAQRERFLRPIFTAEEIWCQLFSEPGAGSDVAGLATRAVRDGDEWIVNGQKIWTSSAHLSRFGLLLARTNPDAPKHKGLTMFIIDMHQPGVEVRPIRSMAGASGFNEVFFTDARTTDEWRVGEIGEGWSVGTATLMNERVAIGSDAFRRGSGPIANAVGAYKKANNPSRVLKDRLLQLWIRAEVLRLGSLRAQSNRQKGVPGPEGSILKLSSGQLNIDIAEFIVDALGADALVCHKYSEARGEALDEPDPVIAFVASPASTIAGGSNDIQRNIIGDRVLRLPREPMLDPNTPWTEIPRS